MNPRKSTPAKTSCHSPLNALQQCGWFNSDARILTAPPISNLSHSGKSTRMPHLSNGKVGIGGRCFADLATRMRTGCYISSLLPLTHGLPSGREPTGNALQIKHKKTRGVSCDVGSPSEKTCPPKCNTRPQWAGRQRKHKKTRGVSCDVGSPSEKTCPPKCNTRPQWAGRQRTPLGTTGARREHRGNCLVR